MENELIEMKESFEVSKILFPTEKYIQAIEDEFREFPTDMTVPENYIFVKDGVKKVKKYLTDTEKYRKSSQAKALKHCQDTNAAAKVISGRLSAVNDPMIKVVKDHETKEEIVRREGERLEAERQENIETKISAISGLVSGLILAGADVVKKHIEELTVDDVYVWADEHAETVQELKNKTLVQLGELYTMKTQAEAAAVAAEKAETERVQRENEAQDKRNAELKAVRIENARLQAEAEKRAEELRIAAQKIKDHEDAVVAAKAEETRLKKERAEKAAEDLRQKEAKRKKEKEDAERAEVERVQKEKEDKEKIANRKKAVSLTVKQLKKGFGSIINYTTDAEFIAYFIQDIQANEFNHIKWVD